MEGEMTVQSKYVQIKLPYKQAASLNTDSMTKLIELQSGKLKVTHHEMALITRSAKSFGSIVSALELLYEYAGHQDSIIREEKKRIQCLQDLVEIISLGIGLDGVLPESFSRVAKATSKYILSVCDWRCCQWKPSPAHIGSKGSFVEELRTQSKVVSQMLHRIDKHDLAGVDIMDICIVISPCYSAKEMESILAHFFGQSRMSKNWSSLVTIVDIIYNFMLVEENIDHFYGKFVVQFADNHKLLLDSCPTLRLPYVAATGHVRAHLLPQVKFSWFSDKVHTYHMVKRAFSLSTEYGETHVEDECPRYGAPKFTWFHADIPNASIGRFIPEKALHSHQFIPYRQQAHDAAIFSQKVQSMSKALSMTSRSRSRHAGEQSLEVSDVPISHHHRSSFENGHYSGKGSTEASDVPVSRHHRSSFENGHFGCPSDVLTEVTATTNVYHRAEESATTDVPSATPSNMAEAKAPFMTSTLGKAGPPTHSTLPSAVNQRLQPAGILNGEDEDDAPIDPFVPAQQPQTAFESERVVSREMSPLMLAPIEMQRKDKATAMLPKVASAAKLQRAPLTQPTKPDNHAGKVVVKDSKSSYLSNSSDIRAGRPQSASAKSLPVIADASSQVNERRVQSALPKTVALSLKNEIAVDKGRSSEEVSSKYENAEDSEQDEIPYSGNVVATAKPLNIEAEATARRLSKKPQGSTNTATVSILPNKNTKKSVVLKTQPKLPSGLVIVTHRVDFNVDTLDKKSFMLYRPVSSSPKRNVPAITRRINSAKSFRRDDTSANVNQSVDYSKDYLENRVNKKVARNINSAGVRNRLTSKSMNALGMYTSLMNPSTRAEARIESQTLHISLRDMSIDSKSLVQFAVCKICMWWRYAHPRKLLQRRLQAKDIVQSIIWDTVGTATFTVNRKMTSNLRIHRKLAAVVIQREFRRNMGCYVNAANMIKRCCRHFRGRKLTRFWATIVMSILLVYRFVRRFVFRYRSRQAASLVSLLHVGYEFLDIRYKQIMEKRVKLSVKSGFALIYENQRQIKLLLQKMESATMIQKYVRILLARLAVYRKRHKLNLQRHLGVFLTSYMIRFRFCKLRPKIRASKAIQSCFRGWSCRMWLYRRIYARIIIGNAYMYYKARCKLRVDIRRKDKPYTLELHRMDGIPFSLFSSKEVTVKVSVWWNQLLHIISEQDFYSIVASKKPNLIYVSKVHTVASDLMSQVKSKPNLNVQTNIPPVADPMVNGKLIPSPSALLEADEENDDDSSTDTPPLKADKWIDESVVPAVRPPSAGLVPMISTDAEPLSVIDEMSHESGGLTPGHSGLFKIASESCSNSIAQDIYSNSNGDEEDSSSVSSNESSESVVRPTIASRISKVILPAKYRGVGARRSRVSFAMSVRDSLVKLIPSKAIRESIANSIGQMRHNVALLPNAVQYHIEFGDIIRIPSCHGNTAIKFEFLEGNTRKVATYTFFMSKRGKMLFKEGEVKGNVKTLTQNRYGSLSKINEDTPILHFDMWPGIRADWAYIRIKGVGPGKKALQNEAGIHTSYFSEWKKIFLSLDDKLNLNWYSSRNVTEPFHSLHMSSIFSLKTLQGNTLTTQFDSKIHDTQNVFVMTSHGDNICMRFRESHQRRQWERLFKSSVSMVETAQSAQSHSSGIGWLAAERALVDVGNAVVGKVNSTTGLHFDEFMPISSFFMHNEFSEADEV